VADQRGLSVTIHSIPENPQFHRSNLTCFDLIFSEESECLNPIKRGFLVAAFAKRPSRCPFYCRESIRSTNNRKANNRKANNRKANNRKGGRRDGLPRPLNRWWNLTSHDSPPPYNRTKS
jgi:hypothetical protein